jgi:two-component system, OmpR family, alkaline phosphatase synthesis response regulator PhoP
MPGEKILVVDDEPDIVETLSFRLEQEGYEVITAADGLEALDKARKESPDLLILDIMMPKLDGFQVSRMLKFDERYHDIPIIMLTAKTQEHDVDTGMTTGADEYIKKPFDAKELIDLIKAKLAASRRT